MFCILENIYMNICCYDYRDTCVEEIRRFLKWTAQKHKYLGFIITTGLWNLEIQQ